jgi:hypothetical protein
VTETPAFNKQAVLAALDQANFGTLIGRHTPTILAEIGGIG